ncbi:MAG: amidohydrolase, partial [Lachnospiraceae bacterium]|nr:amidohydrolase [Lachnospiraceae bacterium]
MTETKKQVLSYIDEKSDVIIDTSDKIWEFAELSLREFKSGELYAKVLREEGFEVQHPFCN